MKRSTKFAIGILIGIGLLALSLLFLNTYLEKNIKTALESNLERVNAKFKKVDVKLLDRKAEVIQPIFKIKGKTLEVDTILLNNIKLWKYITRKDIVAGDLNISNPVVRVYNLPENKKDTTSTKKSRDFKPKIFLEKVKISGGTLKIFEKDSSEHRFYTGFSNISLRNVRINEKTLKESVPFNYDLLLLKADSIFYDLDAQHEMSARDFEIDNNKVLVKDFRIIPKYSKSGHQKTISVEKDRYDLRVDSITMNNFSWSVEKDSLKIRNSFTGISGANFNIYRDKLQPDDTTYKPMYSSMIRKLPVKLDLDSIEVYRTYIRYEEKMHKDREPGVVEFSNLYANIQNLTNAGMGMEDFPKTSIDVNADFMKVAPLKVNIQFDVSNIYDRFQVSGEMGRLPAEPMNKFLKPAMNILAEGEILSMYFNFSGNNNKANGDMRLEYNDFKVEVLRKDGERKNKIVSAVANLFVKNNALNEKAEYKDISFTRDKTRSFWNYFWNLIKRGALKTFL
ncbi:hypothetical protein NE848_05235 [Gramella jeungdoensis]|uniref:DUF748 domain-containing protein n=1 Tax=Gramella jeungdoensis TaxID=708091 RepID=A0ABT0Z0I2_9FLAO|nr:hypothetical protein [Gramella jeungdoensis]MCM8568770.1 hypothetical protein [Gramella jeungdoensis]